MEHTMLFGRLLPRPEEDYEVRFAKASTPTMVKLLYAVGAICLFAGIILVSIGHAADRTPAQVISAESLAPSESLAPGG